MNCSAKGSRRERPARKPGDSVLPLLPQEAIMRTAIVRALGNLRALPAMRRRWALALALLLGLLAFSRLHRAPAAPETLRVELPRDGDRAAILELDQKFLARGDGNVLPAGEAQPRITHAAELAVA